MSADDFSRLDAILATSGGDQDAILEQVVRVGVDLKGLEDLVDRYGKSANAVLVRCIAFQIARSLWDLAPQHERLNALVLTLAAATEGTRDARTIENLHTALKVLSAQDALRVRHEGESRLVEGLIRTGLEAEDVQLQASALELLVELVSDRSLTKLMPRSTARELKQTGLDVAMLRGLAWQSEIKILRQALEDT
jgi:hypothetical protein